MLKKIKWRYVILLLIIVGIPGYLYFQNNVIGLSYYEISSSTIPNAFDGWKVVQVSDLHNKDFGDQLIRKVQDEEPDMIAVTGDVIDRNRTDLSIAEESLEQLIEIAPVYFVSGNHEFASGEYPVLRQILDDLGVVNLDNDSLIIEQGNEYIGLIGLADPLEITLDDIRESGTLDEVIEDTLIELISTTDSDFNLLLAHRPENFDIYTNTSIDVVLSGHAHGGQFRFPFIEGVFAPSQGFLPEFTNGIYEDQDTTMIVSRGLGNSIIPFRINNRPDLVVLTLTAE